MIMVMRSLVALFIVLSFSSLHSGKCMSESPLAPAVYVFGDSLVDNGNNNHLDVIDSAKADYAPYGSDFIDGPTGRVCNGKTVPDFVADFLALPYPTPIMDARAPVSLTGYNYGSAGCGILSETGPTNCLTLTEQVRKFKEETVEKVLTDAFSAEELEQHLANSIFLIWAGNNDYLLNYFFPGSTAPSRYTPEQFSSLLASQLSEKIEVLYGLGARKVVVFEGPPYGCVPVHRFANFGSCKQNMNQNATLFNAKLGVMLQTLSSKLPNSYLSIAKAYDTTYDAINNPANYGFTNVRNACCKSETLLDVACKKDGDKCLNRDEYLFWDRAHPSEASNKILGSKCISDPSVCTPFSIQDLVQAGTAPSPSPLPLLATA